MAKGAFAKTQVFKGIMEHFPNAFWEEENKILRVPINEDGVSVEIKVTLTAAKTNIGDGHLASAFDLAGTSVKASSESAPAQEASGSTEMSEEEKANVARLMASLGL